MNFPNCEILCHVKCNSSNPASRGCHRRSCFSTSTKSHRGKQFNLPGTYLCLSDVSCIYAWLYRTVGSKQRDRSVFCHMNLLKMRNKRNRIIRIASELRGYFSKAAYSSAFEFILAGRWICVNNLKPSTNFVWTLNLQSNEDDPRTGMTPAVVVYGKTDLPSPVPGLWNPIKWYTFLQFHDHGLTL